MNVAGKLTGLSFLLAVLVLATAALSPTPTKRVPVYRLTLTFADGSVVKAQAPAGEMLKVHKGKKIVAVQTRVFNDTMLMARLFGCDGGLGELRSITPKQMSQLKQGKLSSGRSLTARFPGGGSIEVTHTGQVTDHGDHTHDDCCTVTCDDGTTISGCPVRSSCGSC
jgi:hypothetical protein